jgi:hypothetical protein
MTRCVVCHRRIWPWQHFGLWISEDGFEHAWHRRCRERMGYLTLAEIQRILDEVQG